MPSETLHAPLGAPAADAFNAANPVVYSQAGPGDGVGSDALYTDAEEELVMQKLRDLGYVA